MEDLGCEVAHVAHDKHDERLDDPHMASEARHEGGEEAEQAADQCGQDDDQQEGDDAQDDVDGDDVLLADLAVRLKHVVQNLKQREFQHILFIIYFCYSLFC